MMKLQCTRCAQLLLLQSIQLLACFIILLIPYEVDGFSSMRGVTRHNHHLYSASDVEVETSTTQTMSTTKHQKPKWMKCINAVVPPRITALNEAVSQTANVSLSTANELITMGAVWAKMETLTDDEVLEQYYDNNPSSAALKYADFPSGWGSGNENDELYNLQKQGNDVTSSHNEEESLDEYIERQMSLRYRRILTPSTIDPGTDIRIYPYPRRFPSCYDFSDPNRLLYEDTTFIVVDKPPMLPTQPEPSNYEECCPGCVNLLYGPFKTITGEDVNRPLICHRVDSCVGGCVVLSKDGNGQKVFSDLQVGSIWLLLIYLPVAIILYTDSHHYLISP